MTNPWRLLIHPPAHGAWNMAVDEAILESTGRGDSPPTLRLYAWTPACLSLGYAQNAADVDHAALAQAGWVLVRRPTGGRAVLHTDELTYSVIAPLKEPIVAGTILESYSRLSKALLAALELLGLPARADKEYLDPGQAKTNGPVCFEVPSNYEITVTGKKLIGSAQARRLGGVLQHGSLPLYGDLTRITRVLEYPDEAARQQAAERLLEHATTAEAVLGYPVEWESAAHAFVRAFQTTFNIELLPGELTPAEQQRTAELSAEKYANPAWLMRL